MYWIQNITNEEFLSKTIEEIRYWKLSKITIHTNIDNYKAKMYTSFLKKKKNTSQISKCT